MKKTIIYTLSVLLIVSIAGCKKTGNYPGGVVSPYIAILDVKALFKGDDVQLTPDNLGGSSKIAAMVVSDHSGGNLPSGILVVQEARRLSQLRGISINLGADAAKYLPGDSVIVDLNGGVLKRVNGILQITNLQGSAVTKVSSGNTIPVNRVPSSSILANPDKYESVLCVIVKGGFDPLPAPGDVLAGDKNLNDGFGNIVLHTEATAKFANTPAPASANYYGIVFNSVDAQNALVPRLRMRTASDVVTLSSTIDVAPIVIAGYLSDCQGGDGNYEYIQLMATRDINFATTPYSVVVTNNAGTSTPTGYPANGWATGGMRTYKMNITSGTAAKGTLFYVGGSAKLINGSGSASIAAANWVRSFNYTTTAGDGFGNATGGLLANSGNASGIAVFSGTTVTATTVPIDVVFTGTGGSLYTATPTSMGYLIANTDFYDIKNPVTLDNQPYYRSGANTLAFTYNTGDSYFNMLGGEYSPTLGRWTKARAQVPVLLTLTSTLSQLEGTGRTQLKQ